MQIEQRALGEQVERFKNRRNAVKFQLAKLEVLVKTIFV